MTDDTAASTQHAARPVHDVPASAPVTAADDPNWTWVRQLPGPVVFVGVGLSYFLFAQYVIWLNDPVRAGAGYWPAAGITLVALLLLPLGRWGWVVAAIFVAEIGGGFLHGYPVAASGWWAAGNAAEPLAAALVLRRAGGGRLAPFPALAAFFLAGVVLGPLIGAAIGSVGTASAFGAPQLEVFVKWWVGDGLGVLVVAPLLLSFREPPLSGRSWRETSAMALAVMAITALVFRDWGQDWDVGLRYLILPMLLVASVRYGIRGAALSGFLVAELANLASGVGYGIFPDRGEAAFDITSVQIFLAVSLTSALLVAVLVQDSVRAARQYERQRAIGDSFQGAALADVLPTVPGLTLAAGYEAASATSDRFVGGDWYDVFRLSDGSTAFVIGDVAGHDLTATVAMTEVKNGLRSLLLEIGDPGGALAAMDRQLSSEDGFRLVTAIVAVYRDGELTWASAGHPPPLLLPGAGDSRFLTVDEADPMLGVGRLRYQTRRTPFDSGAVFIAYTDGVIEHRSWTLDDGMQHLARLTSRLETRDPHALCDLLLEQGLGGRPRTDDACVLVVRRT